MLLDREKTVSPRARGRKLAVAGALSCLALLATAAPALAFPINTEPPTLSRSGGGTGRTLSTSTGTWLLADSYSYAWERCNAAVSFCLPVAGRTGTTYLLTTADIGWHIRSVVTASNAIGPSSAASATTGAIVASPPKNTSPPTVHGTLRQGFSLTSTLGIWSDDSPANVTYGRQWQRCSTSTGVACQSIAGATGASYQLHGEDVGKFVRLLVTAEGLGASSAPSAPLGPIAAPSTTDGGGGGSTGGGSGGGGSGTTPPPTGGARKLRPFPVVVLAGRIARGLTLVSRLTVRGPRGATVSVRCRGRGCPRGGFRRKLGSSRRMRLKRYERIYGPRARIEIRVTAPGLIGKYTRFQMRGTRPPSRRDACLRPGSSRPSRCP